MRTQLHQIIPNQTNLNQDIHLNLNKPINYCNKTLKINNYKLSSVRLIVCMAYNCKNISHNKILSQQYYSNFMGHPLDRM